MTDQTTRPNRRHLLAGAAAIGVASSVTAANAVKPTPKSIAGKSVLITGSSSGFGRLSALHFAKLGAKVIASMRNLDGGKRPEAEALKDAAADDKLDLTVIEIDVTKPALIDSGVAAAEELAGGSLDVLLNNAGIGIAGPIEFHDHAQAMKQFDVNLFGYHRMARAVLPKMRKTGEGLLVQVSSQLGRMVLPNIGMYCATKFALEAMFETMAYELAPFGIEATIIEPGGYPTKIWENGTQYFSQLMDSADAERKEAYATHLKMAQGFFSGGGTTDPMDIPRAIADIIAMPAGSRPLRKPVHPNTSGPDAINAVSAQVQSRILGDGPYKNWHKSVAD